MVREDTVEGTIAAMDLAGVDRALAYTHHAAVFDSTDGNAMLMEFIQDQPRLVPQFVANPCHDNLDAFIKDVDRNGVRSVRMVPNFCNFPFRDWIVSPWLNWMEAEKIPLWVPAAEVDPVDVYDTLMKHPGLAMVLCEIHYSHASWVLPLLRSLPNLSTEISRFYIGSGMERLMDAVGSQRILYGSRLPDAPMAPNLYVLHRCDLSQ